MTRRFRNLLVPAALLPAMTLLLFAQSTPILDQSYAGSAMVSGKASPGRVPLTVYDTSNETRIALGSSRSMDKEGNFAVSINPPLILGHTIVVVDGSGTSSPAMTVAARPSSPSHQ